MRTPTDRISFGLSSLAWAILLEARYQMGYVSPSRDRKQWMMYVCIEQARESGDAYRAKKQREK